jgi:uncharacterized protein YcfL
MKQAWLKTAGGTLLIGAMAFLCVSCGSPSMGTVKGIPKEEAAIVGQSIIANSRSVASKLAVGGVRSWRDPAGRLNVQVQLANKGHGDVKFQYYFEWMDESGFMLPKDTTGWTPQVVYGYARREIVGVAPSPAAANFRMQIDVAD